MDFVRFPGPAERLLDATVACFAAGAAATCALLLDEGPVKTALWVVMAGAAAMLVMGRTSYRPRQQRELGLTLAWPDFSDVIDEPLLLDDPLPEAPSDSRVVRLFAPETIGVPGELADRIERWLGDARDRGAGQDRAVGGHSASDGPAGAAFHAALTDLRRSLR